MRLQDKIAIVTGASAGIGRAYALALANEGAVVVAAARRLGGGDLPGANTLSGLVQAARHLPGKIFAQACDIGIEADIIRLVGFSIANFGRIDVLVNNAAMLPQADSLNISGDAWDEIMAINVRAPYVAIRETAPHMIRQGAGSIINITANAGTLSAGANYPGFLAYGVSKAALNRLSLFMASELQPHGIAVNCLSPGVVASESALRANPDAAASANFKACTPEVLGPPLLYLAQVDATLTGQILHSDEFSRTWPATA